MKRSLITIAVVLGGLVTPTLPGGSAAARSEVETSTQGEPVEEPRAEESAPLEFPALGLPALEFANELQEEVFWVEGELAARGIRSDYEGQLFVEGDWPGAPEGTFRLSQPTQGSAAWVFRGRGGQRLVLRALPEGTLQAEIRCPGQPVRSERWLPAGETEVSLELSRASGGARLRYELSGNPMDLELAVVSEDPAFEELGGLVYLESLGRRALGRHLATWDRRDRSADAERVPPGRYRLELRERQFLPAPGSQPRGRVVASTEFTVGSTSH